MPIIVRFLAPQSMLAKKLTEVQQEQSRVAIEEGADQEDAGVRQHDLMKWYLDTQTKRWAGDAELVHLNMSGEKDLLPNERLTLSPYYAFFAVRRQAISGYEQAGQEMDLLFKVINKLIRQGDTLAVLTKPERTAEEEEVAYAQRLQLDRVLSLHANYAPDV